jgi:hypothetical protein
MNVGQNKMNNTIAKVISQDIVRSESHLGVDILVWSVIKTDIISSIQFGSVGFDLNLHEDIKLKVWQKVVK